jgi:hypothetical protein
MADKQAGQTSRDEHRDASKAKRVHVVDPFGGLVSDGNYAIRMAVDSGDENVTYIGKAQIGEATSAASWQIQKMDETSGTVITWCGGNDSFNNVWDDREELSYS